jgi:hypothetical protein
VLQVLTTLEMSRKLALADDELKTALSPSPDIDVLHPDEFLKAEDSYRRNHKVGAEDVLREP